MDLDEKENASNQCPGCDKPVPHADIRKHIQNCSRYPLTILKEVGRFDHRVPPNVISFLKIQLQMCLDILNQLQPSGDLQAMSDILAELERNSTSTGPKRESKVREGRGMREEVEVDMSVYKAKIVVCGLCDRKYYQNFDHDLLRYVYDCWHIFCMPCLNKYIDNEFLNQCGSPKCPLPDCSKTLPEDQLRAIMGNERFESMQNKAIRKMYNIIDCFKCKSEFEFVEGNSKDAPKKDPTGNVLKPEHSKDYATNRFVCPTLSCRTEQCRSCQATPYHLGMTCKEYKDRALLKKCRYCNEPLTEKNASLSKVRALSDICNAKECQDGAKQACDRMLGCGHACFGYKGEKECLPCLNEKCAQSCEELMGVNGDEYCAICYVEPLSAGPCVRSGCGHIFHVRCLKKRFEIKWLTPRIFFNFCLCPLCKKWITVSPESELHKHSEDNKALFEKIQNMASERLKFEELEKTDEKLKDKASPYYSKPKDYALAIYAYFQCFKCKNPYFGGRKDCMAAMNEAQNAGGTFEAKELICPNCCEIPVENCPKHGKDFIEFKCKFCCSIAQWFCWGNTHFCEPCHKKQCNGDYVSKYTKDQLPKCKGVGSCPIGGNHGPNGDEKMLGCAICRNYKENNKGF